MSVTFGALVQDLGIGNVIGQPSVDAPSSFRGPHRLRLPQSGFTVPWLHVYTPRPNREAPRNILLPDIIVPADEALEVALEFLRELYSD